MKKIQTTRVYSILSSAVEAGFTTISAQGSSRCFGKGTKVRMYDGRLKNVEDIVIGDKVMNIHGNGYNTVIDVHSGIDQLYTVKQARGIDYVVNSKHILSLRQTRTAGRKVAIEGYKSAEKRKWLYEPFDKDKIHDFEVEWFMKQSKRTRLRYTGFKNTYCELPYREVPIDPYYLGMWLGDGTSARFNAITTIDPEIIEWFDDFAEKMGTDTHQKGTTHRMRITEAGYRNLSLKGSTREMRNNFRALNLIKNKHVPDIYIYNSLEVRLQLLAGLIDSDGNQTGRNTLEFANTNKKMVESVVELCRISGFSTRGVRQKNVRMKRSDGSVYETVAYAVEINHSDFKELNKYIKVPRKRIEKECDRNYHSTTIKIEGAGEGEYFGFELDQSPYFMLEDGTVCHNSGKTYNIILWLIIYALNHPNTRISIVRKTLPALKGSVFIDFKDVLLRLGLFNDKYLNKTELIYYFPNGSWFEFFSTDNEQKLRGRKRQILFVNEGNELTFLEWQQLKMRTTKFTIIDYNPSFTEEHWLYRLNTEVRTKHFVTTYKDNPFLEQVIIDEIESLREKNQSLWQVYGLGQMAQIEGLIFKSIELVDEIPNYIKKRWGAIDFGYSKDVTAIEEVAIHENSIYLDEICYRTHMLTSDIIRELKPLRHLKIISESADPRLVDEISLAGFHIVRVTKYGGSTMAGISKMLEYNIKVTKRSVNAIKEFKNYTYEQNKEGVWLNQPIDMWNHCIDGVRYVILEEVLGKVSNTHEYTKEELGIF